MSRDTRTAVVVGAGMVGLSTAWHLQEDGVEVTVIDKARAGNASSWGNAGWLAPALTLPLPESAILATGLRAALSPSSPVYIPPTLDPRLLRFLVAFARHCTPRRWRRAMAAYREINLLGLEAFDELAAGGVSEPTREARPFLAAFTSDADRAVLVKEFDHVNESGGVTDFDLLTESEIKALEPSLGDAVHSGLRLHGQRYINPIRYVSALADAVRERGGTIIEGTAVRDVTDRGPHGVEVVTEGSTLVGDVAVLATGAWLSDIARGFGVRTLVQAGRGYSFTVQPRQMPQNPIYFPAQRVACTPLGDGFRVAGMMEFRAPDAPLDPRRVKAIVDAATPMLRGVDWEARTDEWVGSRPCTPDGLPLVGATRSDRVYTAGGHGMWGIVLGPLSGRLLARQITRGDQHPLLRHLDPLR